MTLQKWLRRADIDAGGKPATTRSEAAEIRELKKRNRLLEQENEGCGVRRLICRRRTCRERFYPLVTELAAAGIPVTVCRVLNSLRSAHYRWLAAPITPSEVVEADRANALFDAHRDDPQYRAPAPGRRGPRRGVGSDGVADRVEPRLVVRIREETGP